MLDKDKTAGYRPASLQDVKITAESVMVPWRGVDYLLLNQRGIMPGMCVVS